MSKPEVKIKHIKRISVFGDEINGEEYDRWFKKLKKAGYTIMVSSGIWKGDKKNIFKIDGEKEILDD